MCIATIIKEVFCCAVNLTLTTEFSFRTEYHRIIYHKVIEDIGSIAYGLCHNERIFYYRQES